MRRPEMYELVLYRFEVPISVPILALTGVESPKQDLGRSLGKSFLACTQQRS